MDISFIVPTRNEEKWIGACLQSIIDNMADTHGTYFEYDILVLDNSSTDNTPEIAKQYPASVIVDIPENKNVSYMRNLGADLTTGKVLIFIDGDVILDKTWNEWLPNAINWATEHPVLTGAHYGVDRNGSWITKNWHRSDEGKKNASFIPAGHMIISREMFDSVNGFDERLETGEDTDLCRRLKANGGHIHQLLGLKTDHKGVPTSVSKFFKRERWHGKGNWLPLRNVGATVMSKMLLTVLVSLFAGLFLALAVTPWFLLLPPVALISCALLMAVKRCGLSKIVPCTFLASVLLSARLTSLIDVITSKDSYLGRNE